MNRMPNQDPHVYTAGVLLQSSSYIILHSRCSMNSTPQEICMLSHTLVENAQILCDETVCHCKDEQQPPSKIQLVLLTK